MSWEWVPKAIDAAKQPTVFATALLVSGTVLFLPESWIAALGLGKLRNEWEWIVGVVFLLSAVLSVVTLGSALLASRKRRLAKLQREAAIREAVEAMDPSEQAVLREFLIQSRNTIRAPVDHPVVAGLISKGILRQVGYLGERMGAGIVTSLERTETARELVSLKHLSVPVNPTDEEWRAIAKSRPHFARLIEAEEAEHRSLFGPH